MELRNVSSALADTISWLIIELLKRCTAAQNALVKDSLYSENLDKSVSPAKLMVVSLKIIISIRIFSFF